MSIYSIYWSPGTRPGQQKSSTTCPTIPNLARCPDQCGLPLATFTCNSQDLPLWHLHPDGVFYNFRVEVKGAKLYSNYVRKSRLHWLTQPRTTWENFKHQITNKRGDVQLSLKMGHFQAKAWQRYITPVYSIHRYTVYMSKGQGWSFREQSPHLPSWHDTHCNPRCQMCGFSWPRAQVDYL